MSDTPYIETGMDPEVLRLRLAQLSPWRHEIRFSNGVSTADFERGPLFNFHAWNKVILFEQHLTFPKNGRALDIGCNAGYNALYLQQHYGMSGIGIDIKEGHIQASNLINEIAGFDRFSFQVEDASTFSQPDSFDLILHLGTLYHLRHPVLSLENSFLNLRSGGWLCLETQCYGEGSECMYIRKHHDDKSNWFALGPEALIDILNTIGFISTEQILNWSNDSLKHQNMSRRCYILQKP